jgi:hypothetical protein
VVDFGKEIRPTLEQLQRETETAQRHTQELAQKGQALRGPQGRPRR